MSKNRTVTYAGLNADELRVVINDKRAVGLRPGCAITELRALDRTARELQDTCHKQAQRIAALEMSARQALEALTDARRKLAWFTDSYPQDLVVSEGEFFGPIDAAIAKATGEHA